MFSTYVGKFHQKKTFRNEIVDAAGSALRLSKSRCATSWATQIEGSVPVWLADLFIQDEF